jgi:hypothetical protein
LACNPSLILWQYLPIFLLRNLGFGGFKLTDKNFNENGESKAKVTTSIPMLMEKHLQ